MRGGGGGAGVQGFRGPGVWCFGVLGFRGSGYRGLGFGV